MIFQHTWAQVLDGTKTQTRRIPMGGESYYRRWHPEFEAVQYPDKDINAVFTPSERVKWQVGKDYAVQQGRGKPSVGRIKINAIRCERLQDITEQDALAEGIVRFAMLDGTFEFYKDHYHPIDLVRPKSAIDAYRALWDSIHTKTGETWADNPLVWVLEFELVKGRG